MGSAGKALKKKAAGSHDDKTIRNSRITPAQKVSVPKRLLPAHLDPPMRSLFRLQLDVDAENTPRTAVLGFIDSCAAERAIAAARRGSNVAEQLDARWVVITEQRSRIGQLLSTIPAAGPRNVGRA